MKFTLWVDIMNVGQFMKVGMPAEADYDMIRRNFWLVSDAAYKMALREAALPVYSL